MQDYPRTLKGSSDKDCNNRVGFTLIDVWAAYSPVKNSPSEALAKFKSGNPSHSATTGELDIYEANCKVLRHLGAKLGNPIRETFNGITAEVWPRIVWSPLFSCSIDDLAHKVNCGQVEVSQRSVLVIQGENVFIESLKLDGALAIQADPGVRLTIKDLTVENAGWTWKPVSDSDGNTSSEEEAMRGFTVEKHETREIVITEPGEYVISA